MTVPRRVVAAAVCAAVVLATRLPFLARSLDDIDAVNFALAVVDFDPARHQPHPPGNPVYVLLAKLSAAAAGAEGAGTARSLAFLSAIAQAALPLPLFLLFRRLGAEPRIAAAAAALTLLNPVVWINGVRPMSDSVGLLFAVAAQARLLDAAATGRGLVASSALCGLAAGVRVQTLALTGPLWAYAVTRPAARVRAPAVAAFVAAGLAWAVPTVLESGGPSAYWQAFRGTAADAEREPLVLTWTLNQAVRVARHVLFRPWGPEWLGIVMAAVGALGAVVAWRRGISTRLAILAFAPYLVAHALFQQAHTQRYAMPYVPLLALLAVMGLDAVARAFAGRRADVVFVGLAAVAAGAAVAIALPAVAAYGAVDSPAYAVMGDVGRIVSSRSPRPFVLSGHHMFSRYFALAPATLPVLRLPPRREMAALQEAWLAGEERRVLFLAEPRRTDVEAVGPRMFRGRWGWPRAVETLLSGERPSGVHLFEIFAPEWFAGPGWGLSLEMARPDGIAEPVRTAYLRPIWDHGTVMIAGEPTDPAAAEWECELTLAGRRLDRRSCAAPWLGAYPVPSGGGAGYMPLVFTTFRAGAAAGAPFALRGLAYGWAPLLVRGDGWHYPEMSEDERPFRWASRMARSMVQAAPEAAGVRSRLVVEGEVPPRHVTLPVAIELESGGRRSAVSASGAFRIELDLAPGVIQEVILRSDRDFVPDAVQHNGDRRRLALRIYRFDVVP